ncbi:MAG: type II secretion system protein, partial [Candidatus Brocadiales bacterium]|nr:type II secretion system protein [Candidatus Brocadiales bacterium]
MRSTKIENNNGFTILEVMVALAIVGISVGIFFGLIGNSSRLRGKMDEHSKLLLLARTKTEEAFLGILGKKNKKLNGELKEEKTFEGTTKEGIQWKVSEIDKYR